jgi:energy-coupling factor transporter ATP-binding protein EcfA2
MTYEHPSFSATLTSSTVLIKTARGNQGTGTFYVSHASPELVFLITARHCLVEGNGNLAALNDISLNQLNGNLSYKPTTGDRILIHPVEDLAILVLRSETVKSIFGDISSLMLAADNAGETSTFFYGYPRSKNGNDPTRVNTTLLPPISKGIINLESNLRSENDLTDNTVVGFSGSAICLICAGNIYIIGIILQIAEWNRFVGLSISHFNEVLRMFNIPYEPLHNLETNPELLKSHRILDGNSKSLLDDINETVGGIHVERPVALKEALKKLENANVLLVSGVAGAGKSTFSKTLLKTLEETKNAKVISFFGAQICRASTAELLGLLNIPSSLDELMQSRDMNGLKIIYIDSAEKGFEHRQIEVIKELLRLTKTYKELKLVLSIRSYALTLSTFGLFNSTAATWEELTLEVFDDLELRPVLQSFPGLVKLLKNSKVESFIRTPFYLNLLLGLLEEAKTSELDELSLKNMLWQRVIRKDSNSRERLFETIALDRIRRFAPFVTLPAAIPEADLEQMLSDHIIKEHIDEFGIRSYAPAHDILEDWALVRFMRQQYAVKSDLNEFILEIGDTYAMRRGFRFWLQELYRINSTEAQFVTREAISNDTVANPWKDEVTIALINSSVCLNFMEANQKVLLAENAKILIRCIHLVRTACKTMTKGERIPEHYLDEREYMTSDILTPSGPGWNALVTFISKHLSQVEVHHQLIARFLFDWGRGTQAELRGASVDGAFIVMQLIRLYGKDYSRSDGNQNNLICRKLIELLFNLTADNKQMVENFVRGSFDFVRTTVPNDFSYEEEESNDEFKLAFHQLVVEICLNYYTSEVLSQCLPNMVWDIAIYFWTDTAEKEAAAKRKPSTEEYAPRITRVLNYSRDLEDEELFGLSSKGRRELYPVSSLHTPFPHLLKYHPIDAIGHFSTLMNRSLNYYRKLKGSELKVINVKLNNGEVVQQVGNVSLWKLYRGHHFGPDLLKCLHMALENYLLDLAKNNTEANRQLLKQIVDQLYGHNISVSVTAVIASLAMAYPFVLREQMLPIFSFKESFNWDFQRYLAERDIFTPLDQSGKNPGAQKERIASKNLTHRTERLDFLAFKMSFYEGFSKQIFDLIDEYNKEIVSGVPEDYPNWPYVLVRLDRRKYKVTGSTLDAVFIEPELPPAMEKERKAAVKDLEADSGITVWNWCHIILEKKQQENNSLEKWRYFQKLSKKITKKNSTDNILYNPPMGIAEIGLTFYFAELTASEKKWCVDTTIEIVSYYLAEEYKRFNTSFGQYSHWNRDLGFVFLPHLLQANYPKEINYQVRAMLRETIAIFKIDDGLNKPMFEKIANNCWRYDPSFALTCFRELLETAFDPNWRLKKVKLSDAATLPEMNFNESHECLLNVDKAFLFLTESDAIPKIGYDFLMAYQQFLISLTYRKGPGPSSRNRRDYHSSHIHFQYRFGKIMLSHCEPATDLLFNHLLTSLLSFKKDDVQMLTEETFKFYSECIKNVISYQDQNENIERFQALWLIMLQNTIKSDRLSCLNFLLLKWYWQDSAESWPAIRENTEFYNDLLEQLGSYDLDSSIALIAGIGFNDLFPKSLTTFSHLISTSTDTNWTSKYDAEKFIQRAFYNKGIEIKSNKTYQLDFIKILDRMIRSGSSMAYLIKEGFIAV